MGDTVTDDTRERLARAAQESLTRGAFLDMYEWRIAVDAILREMLKPTNGMMLAAVKADPGLENIWRAMVQYLIDEKPDA